MKAIQTLQEGILQTRLDRAMRDRPRTENSGRYTVGQAVDVYRKPPRKDLRGWRGPASLISLDGQGMATVRWQGTLSDDPLNLVRPHVHLVGCVSSAPFFKKSIYLQNKLSLE